MSNPPAVGSMAAPEATAPPPPVPVAAARPAMLVRAGTPALAAAAAGACAGCNGGVGVGVGDDMGKSRICRNVWRNAGGNSVAGAMAGSPLTNVNAQASATKALHCAAPAMAIHVWSSGTSVRTCVLQGTKTETKIQMKVQG